MERTMSRGDTLQFYVQVQQPPPGVPGAPPVPVDISFWSLWFTAKYNYSDPDNQAVAQLTTGSGIVHTNPTIGIAQVTMPPVATRAFPDGPVKLVYDLQAKDNVGNIFTVESGTLTVVPDVTRAIA